MLFSASLISKSTSLTTIVDLIPLVLSRSESAQLWAPLALTVIGGASLAGGRGSIIGTVIGALIFGVIISGFTFLKLDAYYQEMVKGVIIVGAVVLDQWRQRRQAIGG